jgi:hypothetical protein
MVCSVLIVCWFIGSFFFFLVVERDSFSKCQNVLQKLKMSAPNWIAHPAKMTPNPGREVADPGGARGRACGALPD